MSGEKAAEIYMRELKLEVLKNEMDSLSSWDKEWLDLTEEYISIARERLKLIEETK